MPNHVGILKPFFSFQLRISIPVQLDDHLNVSPHEQSELNFVDWSPKGNALVIAYANNLYYRSSFNGTTQQVTYSTANNKKFGIPDWLYEEEILSKDQAVWWSPEGRAFSYLGFDDTAVVNISFSWYGGFAEHTPQYPPLITIPYPKSGR